MAEPINPARDYLTMDTSNMRPQERSYRSLIIAILRRTVRDDALRALKELRDNTPSNTNELVVRLMAAGQLVEAEKWLRSLPGDICPEVPDGAIVQSVEELLQTVKDQIDAP